jgi:tetratricopeptide (TPR) repeat protein
MIARTHQEKAIAIALGLVFCLACLEAVLRVVGAAVLWSQEHMNRSALDKTGAYRIMCIGESTTADLPNGEKSYPRQLLQILTARGRGRKFSVINEGRPAGNTTVLLSELEANLDRYRPDMVIAMMGINDTAELQAFEDARGKIPSRLGDIFKTFKLAGLLSQDLERKKTIANFLRRGDYIPSQGLTWMRWPEVNAQLDVARRQVQSGQYASAEETYDKMLEKTPNSIVHYLEEHVCLGGIYRKQGKYREAEEIYRKAIKKGIPRKFIAGNTKYTEPQVAFEQIERTLKLNSYLMHALLIYDLGQCYIEQGKYQDAEDVYRGLVALRPDLAYMVLAQSYAAQGQRRLAREYEQRAQKSRAHYFDPLTETWKNYRKLMEMLDARGIRLVAVQYPQRSMASLQRMIGGKPGVILVDNEAVFREALQQGGYYKYFVDRCYIDYGHASTEGNRLLAENIAGVLLAEVFNK